MTAGDVALMPAASLPDPLRARWWTPSPSLLNLIEPGRTHVKVLAVEFEADGGADLFSARPVWVAVTERDSERIAGTIVASRLDRDGYRAGDRLEAPLSRVFDLVVLDSRGAPTLNEERARFALGRRVLVGLTVLSSAGELIEQRQFAGSLASVDPERGLELQLDDGSSYWLPPDLRSLEEAPPGEYRLRSTGEVEQDPDYLFTWTITRDEVSPEASGKP